MVSPSVCNPLPYVLNRQIHDHFNFTKRLVNARLGCSENLFRKDLQSHYGCVNAIEFSKEGELLVSGGDDRRVLLWQVEQAIQGVGKPAVMKAQHASNIFCLGYDSTKAKIFSAGNDDQVIVHDLKTGDPLNYFLHEKPVYGLSIHPHNDNVFSSACDDGRVLIYDIRDSSSTETFCLAQYKSAFHSVMFNPSEPRMLATANAKEGVSMWDVRKPLEAVLRYGAEGTSQSCMNVRYNAAGTKLLALRRRLPPVLYAVESPANLCQFDHPGYYNSCTMKSCCFAGDDDQYVLSGSDDFNLYMWKIPMDNEKWVDSAHMVLRGHRSIVNQVRFNQSSCILASSGVEKIIKIWSPFPLGNGCLGGLKRDAGKQERQRKVFTHDEYVSLVLRSGQFMTHDYSHQSTREDPRMMAFFDSLVQREIEGWNSEDAPPGPQTPSDSEHNPTIGRTYNGSDSDDSTASDRQLMLSILGSAIGSRSLTSGGVVPERPSESPNRITQLIANRREKLMRLAALEGGATVNASTNTVNHLDSVTDSDKDDSKTKCKSKSKSKGAKVKHGRISRIKFRVKRKLPIKKEDSDTHSDVQPLDAEQPSTSSGVVSRRSRYAARSIGNDKDSTTSSEDERPAEKCRKQKTDSDCSTKLHRLKKWRRKNVKHEISAENHARQLRTDNDTEKEVVPKSQTDIVNNTSVRRTRAEQSVTPHKRRSKIPPTPDSGISGVSTVEKSLEEVRKAWLGGDSSDHEQKKRNLECFRKKVDIARQSYRHRCNPYTEFPGNSSDSSD
ncbi:DDB1- and CUL4-associated factor 5 [Diprion similis]|uniref:DDB1- and CUL4-associated factor 5 n=1 Tax=Diprion similis TaxID=362088 RepID=UPI001EF9086C|nr:DDB1- and CUL4-associated factor 5 [Diprion similis]